MQRFRFLLFLSRPFELPFAFAPSPIGCPHQSFSKNPTQKSEKRLRLLCAPICRRPRPYPAQPPSSTLTQAGHSISSNQAGASLGCLAARCVRPQPI